MAEKKWERPRLTVLVRGEGVNVLVNCKVPPYFAPTTLGCTVKLHEECYRSGCLFGRQCEPGCEPPTPAGTPGDAFWLCNTGYCADPSQYKRWSLVQPAYSMKEDS